MPSTLKLVEEAVDSFATDKTRSSVINVDRPMLIDLGLILVDPERTLAAGLKWLDDELGEGAISKSAYYRYAAEFRDRFDQVRRRYRQRLAKLSIEHATGGRRDGLAEVLMTQVMSLMAEKVVDTDDLAKLEGRELAGIMAMVDGWTKAKFKREEIDLKAAESERKSEKLEADLTKLRQDMRLKAQRIDERVKQLQTRIDELSKRTAKGERIDPRIFEQIRHELAGINTEQEAA